MRNDLTQMAAFAVVAEERSFTRAANRLGISQSALSHSIGALEKRLGLQLLARTTRSVSATTAGQILLERLKPALDMIEQSLTEARKLRDRPAGRIRIVVPRSAALMVLLPKISTFASKYPDIVLEVTTSNGPVDVVAGEFDAGIQIGEYIQREMIAVRVTQDLRLAAVGSPDYLKSKKIPRTPDELKDHACIGFRFGSGMYRWEFAKGRKSVTVNPQGPISFDDSELVIEAVLRGLGIGVALESMVSDLVARNRLVQVLQDWCPRFPGYFLYYPSRRNQPAALAALVNTLREVR
jgi:DNA-binding transcriptional LysR family regulator